MAERELALRQNSKGEFPLPLLRFFGCFAGRDYDSRLPQALPPGIDPCGENGEFHTFVYDAPVFSRPISRPIEVRTGEVVERDGFVFADVLPSRPVIAANFAG
jgi:hypothetical protein